MKFSSSLIIISMLFFLDSAKAEVSLKDLGLSENDIELSPKQIKNQEELKVRYDKLKTHEVLGLTTLGLMSGTMLTGGSAIGSSVHMYLGMASGAMYFATAYYSLTAPKPSGIKERGTIVWHKRLAWIHFPAMVLAPVLGYMYKQNEENGKKSSSLVKQHSAIAGVGFGAFALSATLMTFEF